MQRIAEQRVLFCSHLEKIPQDKGCHDFCMCCQLAQVKGIDRQWEIREEMDLFRSCIYYSTLIYGPSSTKPKKSTARLACFGILLASRNTIIAPTHFLVTKFNDQSFLSFPLDVSEYSLGVVYSFNQKGNLLVSFFSALLYRYIRFILSTARSRLHIAEARRM